MYKILINEPAEKKFKTFKGLLLEDPVFYNDLHAIYFDGDLLIAQKVFKVEDMSNIFIDANEPIKILATNVRVLNEERQLNEVKEMISDMSFLEYLTKVYDPDDQESLNLISENDYKPKNY